MTSLPERFWNKVDKNAGGGCWLWKAAGNNGYGRYRHEGRMVLAHQLAYEDAHGLVCGNLWVSATCRMRHCVNPAHLELVSPKAAAGRGGTGQRNRIKTHCNYGHPLSGENLDLRVRDNGYARRHCKACTTRRNRERVPSKRQRDPRLCRKQLHEMTGDNVVKLSTGGDRRCRACYLDWEHVNRGKERGRTGIHTPVVVVPLEETARHRALYG